MNTTTKNIDWYTNQFITNSLRQYLKKKGGRLSEPEEQYSLKFDNVIVSTKLLSKEIIGIRGTIPEAAGTEKELEKNDSGFIEVIHFFFDVIISPISFLSSINGDEGRWCLCLPDLEQYRNILNKLEGYFASNKMHLKVYFVSQNGSVNVFYLNPNKKDRE